MNHSGIILLGRGKDALGYPCFINEDTSTGQRYLSYDAEVWFERKRTVDVLEALGKEVPQDTRESISLELEAA